MKTRLDSIYIITLFTVACIALGSVFLLTPNLTIGQQYTNPPDYCDPLPEEPAALSECLAYMGTDGQNTTQTSQQPGGPPPPEPYMPTSTSGKPTYCDPLPVDDSAKLGECMAYMGTDGQNTTTGFGSPSNQNGGPVDTNVGPTDPFWPPPQTAPVPPGPTPGLFGNSTEFATMISRLYMYALGLSAMLAMVMIVIGGYFIMTARGNASQATKGKEYVFSALVGMVLLMAAYLILNTINPDLTNFVI